MKESILKNKKILIVLILATFFLILGIVLKIKGGTGKKVKKEEKKQEILPKGEIIPTVDSSVLINLVSSDKKEAILTIENIPSGTRTIDYELSYLAAGNLPKGVVGLIEVANELKAKRRITLGTCSSGSCVYDRGVEKINVNLKFSGSYGEKIFQKEFKI